MLKLFSDCYTDRRLYAGCGTTVNRPREDSFLGDNSAARIVSALFIVQHLRIQIRMVYIYIFTVGAVRDNALTNCATRVCRACWK